MPRKKLLVVCLLAAVLSIVVILENHRGKYLRAYFLDVGQGDAAFIIFPCGRNMLVDGGDLRQDRTDIVRFLQKLRVRRIDTVVLSHPHSDHLGGLLRVLEHFPVSLVIDSGYPHTTDIYINFLEMVDRKDIPYQTAVRGNVLEGYRDVFIDFLNPPRTLYEGGSAVNNNSVAFIIRYKRTRFLFTGDIENEAEGELVRVFGDNLRSDVLKVPHHGSRTSSTAEFLKAASPAVAVIQVGENNRYGHPHLTVFERYESIGTRIFRTDTDGTVMVSTDGKKITVKKSVN